MVTRVSRRIGLGTGGGRSGAGGGGGGLAPGTGWGSGGGGGSLTNGDGAGGEVDDLEKGQDTDGGQHREEPADDVRRDPVPGEDREPQKQQDDGDQDIREIHDSFHCIASLLLSFTPRTAPGQGLRSGRRRPRFRRRSEPVRPPPRVPDAFQPEWRHES